MVKKIDLKGYKTSQDFKRLKELLDAGYWIIILWRHDPMGTLFPEIARKVPHIDGGVDGDWYSIGTWGYFPTINTDPFEVAVARYGISYVEPVEGRGKLTVPAIKEEVKRRLGFFKDQLIGQSPEDLPRHYSLVGGQNALKGVVDFIEKEGGDETEERKGE